MVSPVRFAALPQPTRANLRRYPRRFAAFVLALVLVLTLREIGLLISAAVYLALGIGGAVVWAVRVARSGGEVAEMPAAAAPPSPSPDH